MNWTAVRTLLYDSDVDELGSVSVTADASLSLAPGVVGMRPRTGSDWAVRSKSSFVLIESSRWSLRNAKPIPSTSPATMAAAALRFVVGLMGEVGVLAVLTIWAPAL